MKKDSQIEGLLKALSRDPGLKRGIAKAKRQTRRKGGDKVETMTNLFLLIGAIYSRFASKKKARALDELMDVIYLLVHVSLLLKENVFDRPEVKEFFSRSSRQVYLLAQECVAMVLPKTKELRAVQTSRSM
jgi:hypothetical protein